MNTGVILTRALIALAILLAARMSGLNDTAIYLIVFAALNYHPKTK